MIFEYTKWDKELVRKILTQKGLLDLFYYLLLKTSGDVEQSLELLERISENLGLFDSQDIQNFKKELFRENIVQNQMGQLKLTSKGEKKIRESSLDQIFSSLKKDQFGNHAIPKEGLGIDLLSESKSYEFGDSLDRLDFLTTINNSYKRVGLDSWSLSEEDMAVFEEEHRSSCATVMMLDISHSMILYGEDRITPAKNVALALAGLIQRKYPKDHLSILAFGDHAAEISIDQIPYLQVGPYHTNTKEGLELACEILRKKKHANKQIFMITDGKPSCINIGGKLYKNPYGLDPRIINQTLNEAADCKRKRITITTFMLAEDPYLVRFIEELTQINRGRAYFSDLENLGQYVMVDFMKNRRRKMR